MRAQMLVHLEHADRFLAEDLLQLVVGIDLPPILGVLKIVLLDIGPDLADDLATREVVLADDLGEFRRWGHGRGDPAPRAAGRAAGRAGVPRRRRRRAPRRAA